MSVNAPNNISFDFSTLNGQTTSGTPTTSSAATDFAGQMAQIKADLQSALESSAFGDTSGNGNNSTGDTSNSATDLFGNANGLSPTGLNTSLRDPQAAYDMMTGLNQDSVDFKAQYATLSDMGSAVTTMQQDGTSLGSIGMGTDNSSITAQMQQFVDQYNAWIKQFDSVMAPGGLMAGTQAAQESRYELDQSVENPFYGAKDGLRGLYDIGLTIDPNTKQASLDTSKLSSVLATNKQGVVDAIDDFSANFATAAGMLNQSNNFIPNQLNNLNSAIAWLNANMPSLQSEFGTGSAAAPNSQVAQALAEYQQIAKT
ncbi:MAG: flagellar filament capping protein FliD [Burkholderiales bacterium]|nr:flagellar filament capping protein FliD [Burkholderiales bacterium]